MRILFASHPTKLRRMDTLMIDSWRVGKSSYLWHTFTPWQLASLILQFFHFAGCKNYITRWKIMKSTKGPSRDNMIVTSTWYLILTTWKYCRIKDAYFVGFKRTLARRVSPPDVLLVRLPLPLLVLGSWRGRVIHGDAPLIREDAVLTGASRGTPTSCQFKRVEL